MFHKYNFFRLLKLEIALAIPASNEFKIEKIIQQHMGCLLVLMPGKPMILDLSFFMNQKIMAFF